MVSMQDDISNRPGGPDLPPKVQHILLLSGLVLLSCGAGLVLFTTGSLSLLWALLPSLAIVAGIFIGLACSWRGGKPWWYFPASMLILTGSAVLILRAASPSTGLDRLWPFLVIFAGISLIPGGRSRRKRMRMGSFVLSISFILMGCFFLLFSMKIVNMHLRDFLFRLWPVFIIASGAVLLAVYLASRSRPRRCPAPASDGKPEGGE